MRAAAATDVGRVRTSNEDSVYADPAAGILIVADGMGGHAAGEVASDLAVRTISQILEDGLALGQSDVHAACRLLAEAIDRANAVIRDRAAQNSFLRGMGTTVAVVVTRGEQLCVGHVGDSRVYLFQAGQIRCLTEDHSLVAQLVKAGEITPGQARKHQLRNVITRSLGFDESARPDIQVLGWNPGDCLVLCSDGLTSMLEDDEIASVVQAGGADLPGICRGLITVANARGGTDNISVIAAQNA